MRTFHPAGAFDHGRGQQPRTAERFERQAGGHDVNDGIHCAHFVEVDLLWRLPVDFAFRHSHAAKYGNGLLFHPIRKFTSPNQLLDVRKGSAVPVPVPVLVLVLVLVLMRRSIIVMMLMFMLVVVPMVVIVMMLGVFRVIVVMVVLKMDIEFGSRDLRALLLRNMQVVAIQAELLQVMLKLVEINP